MNLGEDITQRLIYPLCQVSNYRLKYITQAKRSWPFKNFKAIKHGQWMILSRQFISTLLKDPVAHDLLAFSEHSVIPDEMYFATLALAQSEPVTLATPTYVHFTGYEAHPDWLTLKQVQENLKGNIEHTFFIRKVESGNVEVKRFCDQLRVQNERILFGDNFNFTS